MPTTFDPNTAQNAIEFEKQFAVKAVEHAKTYWDLLVSFAPGTLKFGAYDEEIYGHAMDAFPEFGEDDYGKLKVIDEDWMKSEEGKRRWREFIEAYKDKVADYNVGCLIRTNAKDEYTETNSTFVMRIQFLAIEIARNKLGLNDKIHEEAKAEKEKEKELKEKEKLKGKKN